MNEAADVEPQAAEDSTPGAILKRERERRALSLQQIADELHLDPWIVEAIEANRFVTLGAPVYARGHLRKYATHLGLSPDEIIERYERLQDTPVVTDPIPTALADPVRPPRRSLKGPAWALVGVLVLALIGWAASELLTNGSMFESPIAATSPPERSAVPVQTAPALESEAAAPEASADAIEEPTTTSTVEPAVQPTPAPEPARVAEAGSSPANAEPIEIRLEFSGESWTEIYDATGARLMYATGTAGRARTIVGVPPLQVNLGSVSAVSLEVNGKPVPIPRREGRESARFVIEPDGNLR